MKAVHFGAGNIGRGFIGELLYESGFSTTFVDVVKATVDYINETNSYEMYIIDNNEKKVIKNVKAFSPITNEADIVEAICEADLITTSVCVDNLDKIAPTLAKGLKERLNRGICKVDVMACENAFYATDMLKKALVENTKAPVTEEELDKVGAFPNVAVDRIALSTVINGVRVPQIQAAFELVIEKDKMVNPEAQPIKGAEYVENLGMYLERKLYVFNCGHAATAYFGYHNNCETIHDALEVPEIKADVVAVMKESAMAMTKKYPFKFEELEAYIEKILKKLSKLGPKKIVLTGVYFEEKKLGAATYDQRKDSTDYLFSERIPGSYHGTGDVFASALLSGLLNNFSLSESAQIAVNFTADSIRRTYNVKTDYRFGVNFEQCIPNFLKELKLI